MDDFTRFAHHEAGHAVVGLLEHRAGRGPAPRLVTQDRTLFGERHSLDVEAELRKVLAGGVAEWLATGEEPLGAEDDLRKALDLGEIVFLRALRERGLKCAGAAHEDARRLIRRALHRTALDLRMHWPAVAAVAAALERHGMVSPELLEILVDRAPPEAMGSPSELRALALRAGRPEIAAEIEAGESLAHLRWLATVERALRKYAERDARKRA